MVEEDGPASMAMDPPVPLADCAALPSPARRLMPPAAPLAESPVVILILPLAVPKEDPDEIWTAPLIPAAPAFCVDSEALPLVKVFDRPDMIETAPPVAPRAEPDCMVTPPPTPL